MKVENGVYTQISANSSFSFVARPGKKLFLQKWCLNCYVTGNERRITACEGCPQLFSNFRPAFFALRRFTSDLCLNLLNRTLKQLLT